jgi:alkylation response protein AidB-like acyl-CoA dehydrogenase
MVKTLRVTALIAKLYSAETAQEIVDEALQSFGGPGVVHGGSRISRNIIHEVDTTSEAHLAASR